MSYFSELFSRADAAGKAAAAAKVPVPMRIQGYEPIADGVCGFAWVNIRPGNCAFAKFMKNEHRAHKAYHGGVDYWISDYNQSMEKKEAYAYAFAKVVSEVGIKAYAGSRMD